MEAIEVITSKTVIEELYDENGENHYQVEVPVWNATLANLTLMAFGSSAPEIILSVIETIKTMGKPAGELGAATIVGSAAFNLLVISGVSVYSIQGGEVKKINDVGVFFVTAVFSLFAYVWLFLCLSVNSPDKVTTTEAWLTLGYFFILLILAYGADRYNESKQSKKVSEQNAKSNEIKLKKATLREISRKQGEITVLEIAQGLKTSNTRGVNEIEQN